MAPLALQSRASTQARCFSSGKASISRPARVLVVRASKGEDNPYHDRNYTKDKGTLGGFKDINAQRKDKQDQFEYQQERLEWRRKNQEEGVEDRVDPPRNNMVKEPDFSAEKRGPEVKDTSGNTASLSHPDNAIGKVIRKITGKGDDKE